MTIRIEIGDLERECSQWDSLEYIPSGPSGMFANDGPMRGAPKAVWLYLLRELSKCTGQLHMPPDRFSAIGALCYGYRSFEGGVFKDRGFQDLAGYERKAGAPKDVLDWTGLDTCPGIRWGNHINSTIVAINDGLSSYNKHPFTEIQAIIDQNL